MVETTEIIVFIVSGVAAVLALIVCVLVFVLCRLLYGRRKRKHQISTSPAATSIQGTALTTLTNTAISNDKNHIPAFSASGSGRDVNSIVKSDTSTTSSNHIRVSDGSASSGNSTKAEVVATSKVATAGPPQKSAAEVKNQHSPLVETVSADYAEIEGEDKSERKQKGDTLQSAADSTLSTVSSFNSSMRDSTLLYDGGQDSFLDNLEPGAHNTPKFPIGPAKFNHAPVNMDYEKDPNYVQDHDYEQDPDYEKQKRFDPPLPPAHLYQALKQRPSKEHHYREPENTLRPLSEKLPSLLEQPDYADTIPHCNSLITPKTQNYTQLRASTLDPLPHYTHLDINTKEHIRGSGLSYVTTETDL